MRISIRKLTLDVLKPHKPTIVDLSAELCRLSGAEAVDISAHEIDKNTETVKLTLTGPGLNYPMIRQVIEQSGGVIHSVNEVSASKSKK